MEFRVLGPVEARSGSEVDLAGSKIHTALAALLLARGGIVPDGRLNGLLWGSTPPVTANAQIYTYMSRLRKRLGPEVRIVRRQPGYLIRLGDSTVDLHEFERLEREGRKALDEGRHGRASTLLGAALGLWRGPALANVTEFMQETELPRLEEARMIAWENRIEADLALGRHQQVTSELTWLVKELPLRERLRAQLMTALYRSGRQAEALQIFSEGRTVLAEELGVDPGEALSDAYHALLQGDLGLPSALAIRSVDRRIRRLRAATAPNGASGREREPGPLCGTAGGPRTVRAARSDAEPFQD